MSYTDFWFIDTTVQTRNFRRYFIWFILLFAFVSIGSVMAVKSMYQDMTIYRIQETNPQITVSEAKATNVNRSVMLPLTAVPMATRLSIGSWKAAA